MTVHTPYEALIERNRVPIAASYVTMREYQVLSMYALGDRQADIARKLRMSPKTVNTHVKNCRVRLQVATIPALVALLPKYLSDFDVPVGVNQ